MTAPAMSVRTLGEVEAKLAAHGLALRTEEPTTP